MQVEKFYIHIHARDTMRRTCYIAGEYVRMLKRKQPELGITDKDVIRIQIAALCHNLGMYHVYCTSIYACNSIIYVTCMYCAYVCI